MAGHRTWAGVVIIVVLAGLAEGAEPDVARIVVELSNHAGVAAETLTEAKRHVSGIYKDVGVEVLWTDAADPHSEGEFVVHLVIRSKPPRPRMMGNAFGDARDTGGTAFVYGERVLDVARSRGVDVVRVLAYAMAHEMGHLLLPYPSHAVTGIMHADWSGDELRDIAAGVLRFAPAQAGAIRERASKAAVTAGADGRRY